MLLTNYPQKLSWNAVSFKFLCQNLCLFHLCPPVEPSLRQSVSKQAVPYRTFVIVPSNIGVVNRYPYFFIGSCVGHCRPNKIQHLGPSGFQNSLSPCLRQMQKNSRNTLAIQRVQSQAKGCAAGHIYNRMLLQKHSGHANKHRK